MEMQEVRAIGGRSLGKDGDVIALLEDGANLLVDDPGMAATAAAQENRIVARCQPADQRPVPDLLLGNEGGGQGGIEDEDVDPGNMIGDDQCAGHGMPQVGVEFDAQCAKEAPREAGLQAQARWSGTKRHDAQHEKNHPAQDLKQTHPAQAAQQ